MSASPPVSAGVRLVVVEGGAPPARTGQGSTLPHAAAQVLAGAALRAALEQSRLLGLLLLGLVGVEVALQLMGQSPQPGWLWRLAVLLLGSALVLARSRWLRPVRDGALLAVVGVAGLLAALPPWLGPPEASGAWLPLAAAFSVALAAALAPHALASSEAALVALAAAAATAAAAAAATATPSSGSELLLGAAASALALLLAARLRRRWQRHTLHALDQAERLRRLQQQLDAAERNDADKSRFLAIACHDLRQPVHALGLFAATLHKRLVHSTEESLARNLMRSVDGLERSFNAILDVSRLDGGAVASRPQTFPLRDVFRRLQMQYGGQAELAGLALRFSPGGKRVTSDAQLLERILGNLVQNAIRYTSSGGVAVVARNTHTHLNIEVWDTGHGVSAENLPRIFDEFFQVGRGERDRSQGLGMGLAIVKRLVALLGHRLEVRSVPGRGTMFRLGVALGTLGGIEDETAAADTQAMAPETGVAQMVLVVDDEEPIREGLRALLQEWGYQAMTAADAGQAEQAVLALEGRVDLVLTDLHLGPGPGGQDVVANVRRLCGRELPAILVTGDTAGQALRTVATGSDPVLFKPVQPHHLLRALRNALEVRSPHE